MENTPKIRGYVADKQNEILLLYRWSNRITYLISLYYDFSKVSHKIGSRFYGRIYPNRCDLSADGKYFLYFAMGFAQKKYVKKRFCWTGICVPPKIEAIILFGQDDTWGGGGRFVDDRHIVISPGQSPDFDISTPVQFDKYEVIFKHYSADGGWASGKGWYPIENQIGKFPYPKCWSKTRNSCTIYRYLNPECMRPSRTGQFPGGYNLHHYAVKSEGEEVEYPLVGPDDNCNWADFDNLGRIIASFGSKFFIFESIKDAIQRRPKYQINIDEMIISGKR